MLQYLITPMQLQLLLYAGLHNNSGANWWEGIEGEPYTSIIYPVACFKSNPHHESLPALATGSTVQTTTSWMTWLLKKRLNLKIISLRTCVECVSVTTMYVCVCFLCVSSGQIYGSARKECDVCVISCGRSVGVLILFVHVQSTSSVQVRKNVFVYIPSI